jgi:6-phosphogluconolactonase (cycloisomerase 2 family)
VSTFGDNETPKGAGAGEILKSPDNAFILASNRLAPIFDLPNPDSKNSTKIKSDSIVTFKPTSAGKLQFVELVASGGLTPRHFSLNKDGSKVAIANQQSKSVNLYARDVASGKLGKQVAAAYGLGPGDLT